MYIYVCMYAYIYVYMYMYTYVYVQVVRVLFKSSFTMVSPLKYGLFFFQKELFMGTGTLGGI